MPRAAIPRKLIPLNEAALVPTPAAYAIERRGPKRVEASKQTLLLLTVFTFVGVPVHGGVCWLAGYSLGLATLAVLVTAGALLSVALARWLGLDELLQRLPLLLVLALAGIALVFFTSLPANGNWMSGGPDTMGVFFLLLVGVSLLGSLFRPLAAAYQSLTLRVPFRDLCVIAAGLVVSLALAALGLAVPREFQAILTLAVCGAFGGLVVVEYAAWARANPACEIVRLMAFIPERPRRNSRTPAEWDFWFRPGQCVLAATLFGLSLGLVFDVLIHGFGPTSALHRVYPPEATADPEGTATLLNILSLSGFLGLLAGLFWGNAAMNAQRAPKPWLALRLAWDAITIFLTYPNTNHPLAHRLHFAWLRPQPVRLTLTAVTLLTIVTLAFPPAEQTPAAEKIPSESQPASYPTPSRIYRAQDEDAPYSRSPEARERRARETTAPVWTALPPASSPAAAPSRPNVLAYAHALLVGAIGCPVILLLMVGFFGSSVLPVYFAHFEQPAASKQC